MPNTDSNPRFSPATLRIQSERGSRRAYAKVEANGSFASTITEELVDFLADVDTAFLATASGDGQPYVQHRGGPRGFIRALDETTLAFADFAGNRQYISTGNLDENDKVALIAIDYATRRRVKVWGRAKIVPATPDLVERLASPGYKAKIEQVMLIEVTAWDVNCPQHIPQKVDASEVAHVIAALRARIAELEARVPRG